MVEEGDLDDKLEDKATNEVVDDVKKVAMEGVDKEKKQVAMKVANTNCLDDLIDDALLLLFLLLDCRICIKRRCNSQTCGARSNPLFAHCVHGPLAPREGLKSHLRPFIFHQQKPHKKLLHPVFD